jgi:hypothetical protein
MDGAEFVAFLLALFASASVAGRWLRLLFGLPRFRRTNPTVWVVGSGALAVAIAAAAIAIGGDPQWQRGGISLAEASLDARAPAPLSVGRPSLIGWVWFRVLALLQLKPNPLGGYGGWVHPSAG